MASKDGRASKSMITYKEDVSERSLERQILSRTAMGALVGTSSNGAGAPPAPKEHRIGIKLQHVHQEYESERSVAAGSRAAPLASDKPFVAAATTTATSVVDAAKGVKAGMAPVTKRSEVKRTVLPRLRTPKSDSSGGDFYDPDFPDTSSKSKKNGAAVASSSTHSAAKATSTKRASTAPVAPLSLKRPPTTVSTRQIENGAAAPFSQRLKQMASNAKKPRGSNNEAFVAELDDAPASPPPPSSSHHSTTNASIFSTPTRPTTSVPALSGSSVRGGRITEAGSTAGLLVGLFSKARARITQDLSVMAAVQDKIGNAAKVKAKVETVVSTSADLLIIRARLIWKSDEVGELDNGETVMVFVPLMERHRRGEKTSMANLLQTLDHISIESLSRLESAAAQFSIFAPFRVVRSEDAMVSLICSGLVRCESDAA